MSRKVFPFTTAVISVLTLAPACESGAPFVLEKFIPNVSALRICWAFVEPAPVKLPFTVTCRSGEAPSDATYALSVAFLAAGVLLPHAESASAAATPPTRSIFFTWTSPRVVVLSHRQNHRALRVAELLRFGLQVSLGEVESCIVD